MPLSGQAAALWQISTLLICCRHSSCSLKPICSWGYFDDSQPVTLIRYKCRPIDCNSNIDSGLHDWAQLGRAVHYYSCIVAYSQSRRRMQTHTRTHTCHGQDKYHNGSDLPESLSSRLRSLAEGHTDALKLFAALSICERQSNATSAAALHPQPMVVQPPPPICTHRQPSASYLFVGLDENLLNPNENLFIA